MAGLTEEGFTILTHNEIKKRIGDRLEAINPGFDLSPESPDGQNIEIFSFELSQLWTQLDLVYKSYNPAEAIGQGLQHIGLISGFIKDNADRSRAAISLVGVSGTIVPATSQVSDQAGNKYVTEHDAVIPAIVNAVALVAGPTPIAAGTLDTIVSPVTGWFSIDQPDDGKIGTLPVTEQEYRNIRNRAVMNPSESVADALSSKMIALGVGQVSVINNDTINPLADGTPSGAIHVTITDTVFTNEELAEVILKYKSLGTYTFGSTEVVVNDNQGNPHTIRFTKSVAEPIEVLLDLTFLSEDISGAELSIEESLLNYVNSRVTGEDVIWSHMFGLITPYGSAQINSLTIGKLGSSLASSNIPMSVTEFSTLDVLNITITQS